MSVKTTADEKLDLTKSNLKQAISALHEALFGDIWGVGEYDKHYLDNMFEAHKLMVEAARLIKE